MERQKFEGSWKDAFDQAEASPSEKVWTNIELDLERAESGKIRRRLTFYKMLAAASVFVGLCIGSAGLYVSNWRHAPMLTSLNEREDNQAGKLNEASDRTGVVINTEEFPADTEIITDQLSGTNNSAKDPSGDMTSSSGDMTSSGVVIDGGKKNANNPVGNAIGVPHQIIVVSDVSNENLRSSDDGSAEELIQYQNMSSGSKELVFRDRKLPELVSVRNIALNVRVPEIQPKEIQPDPLAVLLASMEPAEEKNEKSSREKFWTSVGVAAGPFNSINSSINTFSPTSDVAQNNFVQSSASVNNTLKNETKASGIAYSVGFQLGGKVAERWVVNGGVNYLTQSSEYLSTVVVENQGGTFVAANSKEFARQGSSNNKVYTTASHTVNNSMQFVSVPLQAGFLVLNKSFGIQLNGGVSTDLFLQNTITSPGGSLEKVTEESGKESPYRAVNFSGLLNTEFSYRFADRYRIALNPGIRYPFNSIYKEDLGLQSTPITFDIGLRFRYIFN